MKPTLRPSPSVACLVLFCCVSLAQDTTLLQDSLTNRALFADLTLLAVWGDNSSPTSGLHLVEKSDDHGLTFPTIKMADDAAAYSRWDQALHASTALDYRFPKVNRSNTTLVVECDVIWDELESGQNGKWGEGNRFLVALMHDYPSKGPQFGDLERTASGHPFGRPAYHYRIRNCQGGLGVMMSYGGGPAEPEGEFEKYNDKGTLYWLPGFISSAAKGQAPGDEISYDGKKDPYPKTPTQKTLQGIASKTTWKHVTWVVMPERLEIYQRKSSEPAEKNQRVCFMEIPRYSPGSPDADVVCMRLSRIHGLIGEQELKQLPPLYNWFPEVEAIRFYFRGNKTYLANISVKAEPMKVQAD